MKKFKLLFFFILSVSLFSCKDDEDFEVPDTPEQNQDGHDGFDGKEKILELVEGMEDFHSAKFDCSFKTETGEIIHRTGQHTRIGKVSRMELDRGIKEGVYRLLELKYAVVNELSGDTTYAQYGLGCRVSVSNGLVELMDEYNDTYKLFGSGTKEKPFVISSCDHFITLRRITNDYNNNKLLTADTYFQQTAPIDMGYASWFCSNKFGWLGVGERTLPFRGIYDGNGYTITNVNSDPTNSSDSTEVLRDVRGVGLFAFTSDAVLKNIHLENVDLVGNLAVGGLVGLVTATGDHINHTRIYKCSIKNSRLLGLKNSMCVGGLVGGADYKTAVSMDSCLCANNSISGDYNVGGLFGGSSNSAALYLSDSFANEKNKITATYAGVGGLVGVVDTLVMAACVNKSPVSITSEKYDPKFQGFIGAGGLAGGTGPAYIFSCKNLGNVKGHVGVGGILGSTRLGRNENESDKEKMQFYLRDINMTSCMNTGTITGETSVGGLCGEAQASLYKVINEGKIIAKSDSTAVAGGIIGNSGGCSVFNAINTAEVNADNVLAAGGLVGKTTWGSFLGCQNMGIVKAYAKYSGGIVGVAGNFTTISSCANLAPIMNSKPGCITGGIVGEIGDAKKWDAQHTADCLIACGDFIMSVATPFVNAAVGSVTSKAMNHAWGILKDCSNILVNKTTSMDEKIETITALNYSDIVVGGDTLLHSLQDEMKEKVKAIDTEIKAELGQKRNSYEKWPVDLPYGFNRKLVTDYMALNDKLFDFNDQSEENNAIINANINLKREKRGKEVARKEQIDDIAHKIVSGVTLIGGTISGCIVSIATGGALAPTMIATTVTGLITLTNTISATATDFSSNAAFVNQCVNMATITGKKKPYVGGIVGHLQNYVMVYDCLNGGNYADYEDLINCTGGIVGYTERNSVTRTSLNLIRDWNLEFPVAFGIGDMDDLYQCSNSLVQSANTVYPENVNDIDSYKKLNIQEDGKGTWMLKNGTGNYPFPGLSEMMKPIQ